MTRLLPLALLLAGCGGHITNEEIIAEVKKCREAGLAYIIVSNGITHQPMRVHCTPRDEKK